LQRLGKKTEFVQGLRVTDAETRDVALMVLTGIVNKKLVAAIQSIGIPAVGLSGGDGMTFRARKKHISSVDLGFVGEICFVDPTWTQTIWNKGEVPVLASMALGADWEYYNINADQMAASCAVACKANLLIFLTDVPGVKDADGVVIPRLSTKRAASLTADRIITGGMLPKLEACGEALSRGVGRVRILPAIQADVLPEFYFSKLTCGTEVSSQ
jgi:acetylglutamate kinase